MIDYSKRKIDAMHEMFGSLPGKRCEDCSNLIQGNYHGIHLSNPEWFCADGERK